MNDWTPERRQRQSEVIRGWKPWKKSTGRPDEWMPSVNRCEYANRWILILEKYALNVLPTELNPLKHACFGAATRFP